MAITSVQAPLYSRYKRNVVSVITEDKNKTTLPVSEFIQFKYRVISMYDRIAYYRAHIVSLYFL